MNNSSAEMITAAGLAIAGLIAAIHKWRDRGLTHSEIEERTRDEREDREIKVLMSHIERLESLWTAALVDMAKLRIENSQLRSEVSELKIRLATMEGKDEKN